MNKQSPLVPAAGIAPQTISLEVCFTVETVFLVVTFTTRSPNMLRADRKLLRWRFGQKTAPWT